MTELAKLFEEMSAPPAGRSEVAAVDPLGLRQALQVINLNLFGLGELQHHSILQLMSVHRPCCDCQVLSVKHVHCNGSHADATPVGSARPAANVASSLLTWTAVCCANVIF